MALNDYLRDEILEEAELGYISGAEKDQLLAAFESGRNTQNSLDGETPNSPTRLIYHTEDPVTNESDPDIVSIDISVTENGSEVYAYAAKQKNARNCPGVVVIHENKGLTPHIEDVTRRFAREGFVAVAPDLLSRAGGTAKFANPSDVTSALKEIRGNDLVDDLMAAVNWLCSDESVEPGKIGVVGFCFGGGMAWRLITKDTRIKAAVPFYGVHPPLKYVPQIDAKVLAIYGELDDRINSGIAEISEAMEVNAKVFEKIIYTGAQHAFHNDSNPDRYNPEAARQAWEETLKWLRQWL